MDALEIRKIITIFEEILSEGGRVVVPPLTRVATVAVIGNPYAGQYKEDLSSLISCGAELGELLANKAVDALGSKTIESFGKAGIVGSAGELEHVAALIHPQLGGPLRKAVGGGKAIIPSAKKRGAPGVAIDLPMHHKDAAYVRSHYDAMEIQISDAPAPDEIVIALAIADGGRPHSRIGGLQKGKVSGDDGLR